VSRNNYLFLFLGRFVNVWSHVFSNITEIVVESKQCFFCSTNPNWNLKTKWWWIKSVSTWRFEHHMKSSFNNDDWWLHCKRRQIDEGLGAYFKPTNWPSWCYQSYTWPGEVPIVQIVPMHDALAEQWRYCPVGQSNRANLLRFQKQNMFKVDHQLPFQFITMKYCRNKLVLCAANCFLGNRILLWKLECVRNLLPSRNYLIELLWR